MPWISSTSGKRRDGFNVVATMQYTDGKVVITKDFGAANLTDDRIAEEARIQIAILNAGDAALSAITIGPITIPDAPENSKQQAIAAANAALQKAAYLAQLKNLADPDVNAALAALNQAQAAVAPADQGDIALSQG